MARRMVCSYGMSDKIGPGLVRGRRARRVPRPRLRGAQGLQRAEGARDRRGGHAGSCTALYDEARQLLAEHRATLDRISDALLERETLDTAGAEAPARRPDRCPRSPPRVIAGEEARASAEAGRGGALREEVPRRQAARPRARPGLGGAPHVGDLPRQRARVVVGVLNATPDSFSDGGRFVRGTREARPRARGRSRGRSCCATAPTCSTWAASRRGRARADGAGRRSSARAPCRSSRRSRSASRRRSRSTRARRRSPRPRSRRARAIVNDVSGLRFDPALAGVVARARRRRWCSGTRAARPRRCRAHPTTTT